MTVSTTLSSTPLWPFRPLGFFLRVGGGMGGEGVEIYFHQFHSFKIVKSQTCFYFEHKTVLVNFYRLYWKFFFKSFILRYSVFNIVRLLFFFQVYHLITVWSCIFVKYSFLFLIMLCESDFFQCLISFLQEMYLYSTTVF